MLFQGLSILKFSCASSANNQPHQFRRLEARCIIATSGNHTKCWEEFCSENIPSYSEIFSSAPPHSSEVRYGPAHEVKYVRKLSHIYIILWLKFINHLYRVSIYAHTSCTSVTLGAILNLPRASFIIESNSHKLY